MTYAKLYPSEISVTVEKPDVIILYIKQKHCLVCDKSYKPRKLKDGRVKYRLATPRK